MSNDEPGFLIGDERYEIPTLDTITLDEERILYLYSDTVLQDFSPAHPEAEEGVKRAIEVAQAQKIRNPDFKRALAHIAYRRRHPDVTDAEINQALGEVTALELDHEFMRSQSRPPAQSSQKQPGSSKRSGTLSRPSASGSPTESDSGQVVEIPARTGTGG